MSKLSHAVMHGELVGAGGSDWEDSSDWERSGALWQSERCCESSAWELRRSSTLCVCSYRELRVVGELTLRAATEERFECSSGAGLESWLSASVHFVYRLG